MCHVTKTSSTKDHVIYFDIDEMQPSCIFANVPIPSILSSQPEVSNLNARSPNHNPQSPTLNLKPPTIIFDPQTQPSTHNRQPSTLSPRTATIILAPNCISSIPNSTLTNLGSQLFISQSLNTESIKAHFQICNPQPSVPKHTP